MQYDDLYDLVGHFGLYQFCVFLCCCINVLYDNEAVTMVFVGGDMDHFCKVDRLSNLSYAQQRSIAIPVTSSGAYSECTQYDRDYEAYTDDQLINWNSSAETGAAVIDCTQWVYDQSTFISTIVGKVSNCRFLSPWYILFKISKFS